MEQNEGQRSELVTKSDTSIAAENPVTVEKQVPQSVVNRVVAEVKQHAFEQGRKSASIDASPFNKPVNTDTTVSNASPINDDHIKKIVAESINKQNKEFHDLQMQQAAQEFLVKLKPGETKYADFNQTVNSVNWNSIPQVLDLANQTENTDDVVYELAKNPQKAINLWQLSQVNPQAALAETKKLAESIKQNQRQPVITRPPLSPLTPSITRMASGSSSLRDLKESPNYIF